MDILAAFTFGTIALALLFLLLQLFLAIVSLYLSAKLVSSINDEFTTALKTFGWWTLVGIGYGILSAVIGFLVSSIAAIALPILFVVMLVVDFIIAKKMYDLGIGKTLLMMILYIIFSAILGTGVGFLATLVLGFSLFGLISSGGSFTPPTTFMEPTAIVEEIDETNLIDDIDVIDDTAVVEEVAEPTVEEVVDDSVEVRKPKFPKSVEDEAQDQPEENDNQIIL
ncbi:hypothetical protein JW758_01915 [Candidatus Peregrinibacteria bacterium]|nr:hypothetical protein [Candidatus Peregrinibacteria bacterium]